MELIRYNEIENIFENNKEGIETFLPQIVWHITSKCKLNCKFCFSKKNLDVSYNIENIILLLKNLKVLKVDISGGEPLLSDKFISICEMLFKNGFYITVTTTGLGNEKNFKWLLNNVSKFSRIIFSIDGDEVLHDELRGKGGTYNQTIIKINKLKKIYSKIRINTVVTTELLKRDYNEFISIIDSIHPYEWCLIDMHPANDKGAYTQLSASKNFDEFLVKVKSISKTKIIQRKKVEYSGYWSINSDNTISMHSQTSEDRFAIEIKKENLEEIKRRIGMEKSKYPSHNSTIQIINMEDSQNISYMLKIIEDICKKNNIECDINKKNIPDKKCEIVTAIAMGVLTNAVYDAIKYAVNKAKHRKGYESEKISMNGVACNLDEAEKIINELKTE